MRHILIPRRPRRPVARFCVMPDRWDRRKMYIAPRNIFIDSPFSPRLCFFPFSDDAVSSAGGNATLKKFVKMEREKFDASLVRTTSRSVRGRFIIYRVRPSPYRGRGGCAARRKSPLRIHEIDSSHLSSDMCTYHYHRRDPTSGRSKHTSPSRPIPSAWGSSRSW